jgi:hypothetical protein
LAITFSCSRSFLGGTRITDAGLKELAGLKREFESARTEWESAAQQLRGDLDELNRQLGNA